MGQRCHLGLDPFCWRVYSLVLFYVSCVIPSLLRYGYYEGSTTHTHSHTEGDDGGRGRGRGGGALDQGKSM